MQTPPGAWEEAVDSPVMAVPRLAGTQPMVHRDKRGPWIQPTQPTLITARMQQKWCLSLSVTFSGEPAMSVLPELYPSCEFPYLAALLHIS